MSISKTVRGRSLRWLAAAAALATVGPFVVWTASSAGAASMGGRSEGLQPRVVNATDNQKYIFGEPEVAVNPKNNDNLVYVATQLANTPQCQLSADPNCQWIGSVFGPQPAGLVNDVPGFSPNGIEVSFNGGRSWKSVTVPTLPPPCPAAPACNDPTGFLMGGDPAITATPSGTFVFTEDVVNFQTGFPPETPSISRDSGIATSVSTDGGLTWSTPVLSGTAADRDFVTTDPNTGRIYEESGSGPLGPGSTANPDAPTVLPSGRYLVASSDGVHWTKPAFLGAGIGGPFISAANGVFATGGKTAAGEVFQTTTNDGASWTQH
ncbi:MAG: glycoside hydrolase, partial [Thermoplasmata archaeon]|nr:glycoside hydrolase [Thermoplasmata archaeon]